MLDRWAIFEQNQGINIEALFQNCFKFWKREFPESTDQVAGVIIEFVKAFENGLLVKRT